MPLSLSRGSTQSRILNDICWLGLIARPPDRQKVKRQWSSISYLNPTEDGIETGTDSSKKGVALCQASEQLDQAVKRFEWISSAKISWDWEYTLVTILYSHELAKTSSVQLSLQCWDIKDCWAGVRGEQECKDLQVWAHLPVLTKEVYRIFFLWWLECVDFDSRISHPWKLTNHQTMSGATPTLWLIAGFSHLWLSVAESKVKDL